MSRQSVQIQGDNGRTVADVDRINDAVATIGEVHANIHRGIMFVAHRYIADYDNTPNYDVAVTVPEGSAMHVVYETYVTVNSTLSIYENTVLNATPGGTLLTPRNKNRFSSNTADCVFRSDPTIDNVGTLLYQTLVPGGRGAGSTGGQTTGFAEWVLDPGTYLFRLRNIETNNAHAGIVLNFYEPSLD